MVKRRFLCSLLCFPPAVRFWRSWERTPDSCERMRRSPRSLPGFSGSLREISDSLLRFSGFALPNAGFAMGILSKTHQSSLTLKGGSTSHLGLLPSGEKRKPLLLVARNHFILWLADHQRSRQQRSCILRYATAWIHFA